VDSRGVKIDRLMLLEALSVICGSNRHPGATATPGPRLTSPQMSARFKILHRHWHTLGNLERWSLWCRA
jgi:hypothetical protein